MRNGKIARLPHDIREQLNRRLQDGEQGKSILKWLNALPEVQAVLKEHFEGHPIAASNFTEWKDGGYRDWQVRQDALAIVNHLDDEVTDVLESAQIEVVYDFDRLHENIPDRYWAASKKDGFRFGFEHPHPFRPPIQQFTSAASVPTVSPPELSRITHHASRFAPRLRTRRAAVRRRRTM